MKYNILLMVVFLLFMVDVSAREKEYSFGGYLGVSSLGVDDDNGKSETSLSISRLGFQSFISMTRLTAITTDLYYFKDEFAASYNTIGQSIDGFGVATTIYRKLLLSKRFTPYIGGGFLYSSLSYTDVFSIDREGYLLETYPNRKENELSVLISLRDDYVVADSLKVFIRGSYQYPLSKGFSGFIFDVGLMF